ncbi:hypothetical protein SODALDRAFT_364402 [Sodiomyces alkalinus F11]|uniref:Uncharacterized protein n=1 Tax=Sodiomyces alkalinus (strain CBS 110278 / VKM F-3762 / F11) TaxID=1314773 RepID=A0A3N2PIV6_SODAK|nr:hypothetical protein SODALDRAFT_364402 [Sodiomyces alkalinus F11]ROT34475.1 hypothetical protein SODALDRAFT_364402 [Sodiomyces alkalinus F11]
MRGSQGKTERQTQFIDATAKVQRTDRQAAGGWAKESTTQLYVSTSFPGQVLICKFQTSSTSSCPDQPEPSRSLSSSDSPIRNRRLSSQLQPNFTMKFALAASLIGMTLACPPPAPRPEYQGGYIRLIPCWWEQAGYCLPWLDPNTQQQVFPDQNFVVVVGISDACVGVIAEEHARELDGRPTYGWTEQHGQQTVIGNTLVITGMTDLVIQRYQNMRYVWQCPDPYAPCHDQTAPAIPPRETGALG